MSRPRAGHAWTAFKDSSGRFIHLIAKSDGRWITTGEAQGWHRCPRCRKPFDVDPFDSGLCVHCYFYGNDLPSDEFWRIHKSGYPFAPYNIGQRVTKNRLDLSGLSRGDWRKALREQQAMESAK
ncbi:MAG TPA: hypothetical protein VL866_24265 [Pyrinomonadaceae bacterium]|nr:hypothetical protein [Pyrinomonadaceae bacterium]